MDAALLATLTAHNPWLDQPARQPELMAAGLPDPFIPRLKTLELTAGRVELVVGPRQAGKSTWIREALSHRGEPVLILNAEEPRIRELAPSPALAMEALRDVVQPSTILVFDEIQHLRDASLFLKGLVDLEPGRRVVATGSSSFALRARTRESLAGRARRTLLLPFSLEEVAQLDLLGGVPAVREARLVEHWQRLLLTGGYPEPFLADRPVPVLHHLVESFVLRDASDLHNIERPGVFRKLLDLAAADVGNLVNNSEWASLAQASRTAVARYLSIAEDAHVLRLVPPFVGGRRAEVTGTPKVYFVDNGLRNVVFGGFDDPDRRSDRGALWENAVYAELLKRTHLLDEIRFWRSKNRAEVDFVVRRRKRLVAVEAKAGTLPRPTVTRAARSFLEAYRPVCLGIINGSLRDDTVVNGVPVLFRRPWELGEVLDRLGG
jgi:predicted AAA+ superfamily ATPase